MIRFIAAGALALALACLTACAPSRDDGMGDLYLGVACVQRGDC